LYEGSSRSFYCVRRWIGLHLDIIGWGNRFCRPCHEAGAQRRPKQYRLTVSSRRMHSLRTAASYQPKYGQSFAPRRGMRRASVQQRPLPEAARPKCWRLSFPRTRSARVGILECLFGQRRWNRAAHDRANENECFHARMNASGQPFGRSGPSLEGYTSPHDHDADRRGSSGCASTSAWARRRGSDPRGQDTATAR
jgi:hypothetical protein